MAASSALSAVAATVTAGATSKFNRLSDKATKKEINWIDYNWPSRRCGCNILHLPPWDELKEYSAATHYTVWVLYMAFCLSTAVTLLNVLTCIILASILPEQYPVGNVVYAVLNVILGGVIGTAAWFKALSGLVEHSNQSKWIAKAAIAFMVIGGLVQALASFGNVNGLSNLGSSRLSDAGSEDSAASGYWIAMTVLESLVWLASVAGYCFGGYRLFAA